MIKLNNVGKSFTLHNQGGVKIEVIKNASFSVDANECVALTGESGAGKSSLIRMIYGNYLLETGTILVNGIDINEIYSVKENSFTVLKNDSKFLVTIISENSFSVSYNDNMNYKNLIVFEVLK